MNIITIIIIKLLLLLMVIQTWLYTTNSVQKLSADTDTVHLDNWLSGSLYATLSVQFARRGSGKMCRRQTPKWPRMQRTTIAHRKILITCHSHMAEQLKMLT